MILQDLRVVRLSHSYTPHDERGSYEELLGPEEDRGRAVQPFCSQVTRGTALIINLHLMGKCSDMSTVSSPQSMSFLYLRVRSNALPFM